MEVRQVLPIISAALTVARALRGLTIPEAAGLSGVGEDDVFAAENSLEDADPVCVQLIAIALGVDLTALNSAP